MKGRFDKLFTNINKPKTNGLSDDYLFISYFTLSLSQRFGAIQTVLKTECVDDIKPAADKLIEFSEKDSEIFKFYFLNIDSVINKTENKERVPLIWALFNLCAVKARESERKLENLKEWRGSIEYGEKGRDLFLNYLESNKEKYIDDFFHWLVGVNVDGWNNLDLKIESWIKSASFNEIPLIELIAEDLTNNKDKFEKSFQALKEFIEKNIKYIIMSIIRVDENNRFKGNENSLYKKLIDSHLNKFNINNEPYLEYYLIEDKNKVFNRIPNETKSIKVEIDEIYKIYNNKYGDRFKRYIE